MVNKLKNNETNTFQVTSGTCRYSGDISKDMTIVNCGFKADLVIFYFMSYKDDEDIVLYTSSHPLDNKYYYSNITGAYGGNYNNSSSWDYIEAWVEPDNNGFKFATYTSDDSGDISSYTSSVKYVAYKFNYV